MSLVVFPVDPLVGFQLDLSETKCCWFCGRIKIHEEDAVYINSQGFIERFIYEKSGPIDENWEQTKKRVQAALNPFYRNISLEAKIRNQSAINKINAILKKSTALIYKDMLKINVKLREIARKIL